MTSRSSLTAFVRTLPDDGRVSLRPAGDALGTLRTAAVVATPSASSGQPTSQRRPSSEPATPSESETAGAADLRAGRTRPRGRDRAAGVPTDGSVVGDTVAPYDVDDYEDQVVSQPELTGYPSPAVLAHVMGGGLSDKDGDPLTPHEAAKRLPRRWTRSRPSTTTSTATRSAGSSAVNLDISGLDGEPLLLLVVGRARRPADLAVRHGRLPADADDRSRRRQRRGLGAGPEATEGSTWSTWSCARIGRVVLYRGDPCLSRMTRSRTARAGVSGVELDR